MMMTGTKTTTMSKSFITPDWPAPANVRALITTRQGGVSAAPYASFNLGDHVGDDPHHVAQNRADLSACLPAPPAWLTQVHGTTVLDAAIVCGAPQADASVGHLPGVVAVVMTADCLPVLLCDRAGTVVAAAHAGWRGLLDGVLERTVDAMAKPAAELLAYLGPAIGPSAFEVGDEVRQAFVAHAACAAEAFVASANTGKWMADLYLLARQRLLRVGVDAIYGGHDCTYRDADRFFSYRRDGVTGRMASLIWLA
jgi:YfiH family protein